MVYRLLEQVEKYCGFVMQASYEIEVKRASVRLQYFQSSATSFDPEFGATPSLALVLAMTCSVLRKLNCA